MRAKVTTQNRTEEQTATPTALDVALDDFVGPVRELLRAQIRKLPADHIERLGRELVDGFASVGTTLRFPSLTWRSAYLFEGTKLEYTMPGKDLEDVLGADAARELVEAGSTLLVTTLNNLKASDRTALAAAFADGGQQFEVRYYECHDQACVQVGFNDLWLAVVRFRVLEQAERARAAA